MKTLSVVLTFILLILVGIPIPGSLEKTLALKSSAANAAPQTSIDFDLLDDTRLLRLGFIQDDPVFPNEPPDPAFRSSYALPLLETLRGEIVQMLQTFPEGQGYDIVAFAASWGYPDNLRLALWVEDNSGNTSALHLAKQVILPQPSTFPILRVDFGGTFANSDGFPGATFFTFQASRTPLTPGTVDVPAISFIEELPNGERIVHTSVSGSVLSSYLTKAYHIIEGPTAVAILSITEFYMDSLLDKNNPDVSVTTIPESNQDIPNLIPGGGILARIGTASPTNASDGANGWFNKTVKFSAIATDNETITDSGIIRFEIKIKKVNSDQEIPLLSSFQQVDIFKGNSGVDLVRLPIDINRTHELSDGRWIVLFDARDSGMGSDNEAFGLRFKIDKTAPAFGTPIINGCRATINVQDITSGLRTGGINLVSPSENVKIERITPSIKAGGNDIDLHTITFVKSDCSKRAVVRVKAIDMAGNESFADPVITLVSRDKGKPVSETITGIPYAENKVRILNGSPGLTNLSIIVNGREFKVNGLRDNEVKNINVASAMVTGDNNTITLTAHGKPGGSAVVIIHD